LYPLGYALLLYPLGYALLLSFQAIAGIQTPPPISEENLDSRNRLE